VDASTTHGGIAHPFPGRIVSKSIAFPDEISGEDIIAKEAYMIYFAIANAPTTPSILYIVSDSLANVNSFTTCRATNPRVIALVHAAYNIAARKGITFIVDHCQSSSNYADDASRLWIKGPDVKDVYYRTDDMNH